MILLRKIVIKILRLFNFDIKINHHWVKSVKIKLNSFRRKGYWWHGRRREQAEMDAIRFLVRPGDHIIEVGAHIGYLTIYFSDLVKINGKVYSFEPGEENLKYLNYNCSSINNIEIIPKAANDKNGSVSFYVEDLSGQNNSLIPNFSTLDKNQENAGLKANVKEVTVECIKLDDFVFENKISPDFLKIDVEGAEKAVLSGASRLIKDFYPTIMLEITGDGSDIFLWLRNMGYEILDENMKIVQNSFSNFINTFCIHKSRIKDYNFAFYDRNIGG